MPAETQLEPQWEEDAGPQERNREKPEFLGADKPGKNGSHHDTLDERDETAVSLSKSRIHDGPEHAGKRAAQVHDDEYFLPDLLLIGVCGQAPDFQNPAQPARSRGVCHRSIL